MPALPVGVVEVQVEDVPLEIEMVGTTMGIQDVPIRARVEGYLETMEFQEGRFVQKGDVLYTIDPQPFQARVVKPRISTFTLHLSNVRARTSAQIAAMEIGRPRIEPELS